MSNRFLSFFFMFPSFGRSLSWNGLPLCLSLTKGPPRLVNILNILKNPMILLGLVSMGIFVGMPYLVDNSK